MDNISSTSEGFAELLKEYGGVVRAMTLVATARARRLDMGLYEHAFIAFPSM